MADSVQARNDKSTRRELVPERIKENTECSWKRGVGSRRNDLRDPFYFTMKSDRKANLLETS